MRMKPVPRRHLARSAGAGILALALAACGHSSSGSTTIATGPSKAAGNVTLHVLTFGNVPHLFDAFTKKTGIQVVTQFVDSSVFPASLQTAVAAKGDVDVINLRGGAEFNKYAKAGAFRPYTDAAVLSTISAAGKQPGVVGGVTYGYSLSQYVIGVTYNKTLFAKDGITAPPKNWDDLMADAAKIKKAGVAPFAYSAADGWTNQYWYHNAVAEWASQHPSFTKDLQSGAAKWSDNTLFTTQISRFAELAKDGYLLPGGQSLHYSDAATAFNVGKAAMWVMGDWNLTDVKPSGFQIGAFPLPINAAGAPTAPASALADNMWAVTKWTAKSAAADQLLAYLAQPSTSAFYAQAAKRASTVTGVNAAISPYQGDWDVMAKTAVPFPLDLGPSVNNDGPSLLGGVTANGENPDSIVAKFQGLQNTDNKTGY